MDAEQPIDELDAKLAASEADTARILRVAEKLKQSAASLAAQMAKPKEQQENK